MWYFHVISPQKGYIKPIISSEDERPCEENNPITFPVQSHGVYPSAMRTGLTSPAIIRPQPFSYSDAHEICSSHLVDRITSKQYEENVPRSLLSTRLYCVERSPSFPERLYRTFIFNTVKTRLWSDEFLNQHVTKYLNNTRLAREYHLKSSN